MREGGREGERKRGREAGREEGREGGKEGGEEEGLRENGECGEVGKRLEIGKKRYRGENEGERGKVGRT